MSEFAVSQPTMRAALRILESEGLIRIQRGAGGGPRVQDLDVGVLAQRAGLYLQLEGADLADLLEALLVLQPGAVQMAAGRRSPAQLKQLRDCVGRAETCTTMRDFSEVATDFVLRLLEASGNRSIKLFSLVMSDLIRSELHRHLDLRPDTDVIPWNAQRFGELVDLIEAGEGEAAAALWRAHMLMTIPSELRRAPGS
jgi:DNA-binding FadR family transcriptional regulator